MILRVLVLGVATVLALAGAPADALTVEQAQSLPREQAQARLPAAHPAVLYAYAMRLFQEGQRDEAVKWFYVGQLRLRFHIAANPGLPPDREPALLASLNATIGQTINEWAGGAPRQWAASIDEALAWDAANENATTSRAQHARIWQAQRKGLQGLRDSILSGADEIRAQRRQRGLENRE